MRIRSRVISRSTSACKPSSNHVIWPPCRKWRIGSVPSEGRVPTARWRSSRSSSRYASRSFARSFGVPPAPGNCTTCSAPTSTERACAAKPSKKWRIPMGTTAARSCCESVFHSSADPVITTQVARSPKFSSRSSISLRTSVARLVFSQSATIETGPLQPAAICSILVVVDLPNFATHSLYLRSGTGSTAICNPFAKYQHVARLTSPSSLPSGVTTCNARRELMRSRQNLSAPSNWLDGSRSITKLQFSAARSARFGSRPFSSSASTRMR